MPRFSLYLALIRAPSGAPKEDRFLSNHLPPTSTPPSTMFQAISTCLGFDDEKPMHQLAAAPISWTASAETRAHIQSAEVVQILLAAEKPGAELQDRLDGVVGAAGWTEYLASAILDKLSAAIRDGAPPPGPAMADALKRAMDAAVDFAREHPVFVTVLALGVLVALAPWVLEAVGFGAAGPIEGAWLCRLLVRVLTGAMQARSQRCGRRATPATCRRARSSASSSGWAWSGASRPRR
jgi:hypothetical protein